MTRSNSRFARDEFVGLVERYNDDLLRLAFAMTGDRALAEDAVQNCWQAAWQARDTIREPDRVRGWLFTITANQVRRQLRRRRLAAILHGRLAPPDSVDPLDPGYIDLARGLARLSVSDRELLGFRFGLGLTSNEIGSGLGLTGSGTRRRLQRVIGRLRRELGDE
ncbi:MAG: sigma-70 family RNA polymerase sigma factor [Chloroflexota bacterium]